MAESGLHILIVDDKDEDRQSLEQTLTGSLLTVAITHAANLASGLKALETREYDCVLVNYRLPDGDALGLISRAQDQELTQTPFIILTQYSDEGRAIQALQRGAQDYLLKSELEGSNLVRSIRYAMERHRINDEIRATQARLEILVTQDPLTELLNRRGLESVMRTEMLRLKNGDDPTFALLIDLDDFDRINERFGHATGDIVLKEIASKIRDSMRMSDYVARIGGDEFLVLLPSTRAHEALRVAERMRLLIGECIIVVPSGPVKVTASLGMSEVTRNVLTVTELLYQTQRALSQSKGQGKNKVSYESGRHPRVTEAELGNFENIMDAICRGSGLRAVKQAIVRLEDESTVGFELLSRGPHGPFESPYHFFKLCQERSVLNLVDLRCVKQCILTAQEKELTGRIHINLFPSTILDMAPDQLAEFFPAQSDSVVYCVEISEQQIIGDPTYLKEHIDVLKSHHVEVALDDVGFGRSCLESLIVLEPDVVKIDRKWVDKAAESDYKIRILKRMRDMAQALGAQLVAEGIERKEDLLRIRDLGIPYGQGYYWGKPA